MFFKAEVTLQEKERGAGQQSQMDGRVMEDEQQGEQSDGAENDRIERRNDEQGGEQQHTWSRNAHEERDGEWTDWD